MKKVSFILFICVFYLASAFGQENLNTTRIGVWPYGYGNAVAAHEDNVFLSYGRAIRIYEYSLSEQPQLLGEVFMEDMIQVFAFENDKAFVAGHDQFYILDISNTAQPEIISSFDLQSRANAICLSSGYVYLALNSAGILILDVSDLYNPAMAAFYQNDQVNYDMVIDNDVAWIASGYEGLTAYDLSNPISPVPILTYNESGSMRSVEVAGSLLYATNSYSGIMVFDISSLPQLQLLSNTPTLSEGTELYIQGDLLAVSLLHEGFCLYDISEPATPDSLGWFHDEWPNRNTILKDDLAFHCSGGNFSIVDISNPYEINPKAQIVLSGIAQYAHYWENHVFIDSYNGSIMAVDVTDPKQPVKVAQIDAGKGHHTIHVNDDLLFTNNYHWLQVYEVSVPSEPVYLNTLEATTTITCVLKHNHLLFVNDYDNLQVFDISDIDNPIPLGVYPYGSIEEITAVGSYLYCVESVYLKIIDFSDPSSLNVVSSTLCMTISSIAIKDTLAYVVCSNYPQTSGGSLKVFNIKDPGNVFLETSRDQGRQFEYVEIEGDYLYIIERNVGLQIYDTQDIYPVLSGFYGNYIYIVGKPATANGISYLPAWAGFDIIQNDLISSSENIFIERSERLNLFPNPAADVINIELETDNPAGAITWEIVQIIGTSSKSGKLAAGQRQINLDGLPIGVYVLTVKLNGRTIKIEKVVKQ
ncbi:MAG: T9SS type A sorting domain-containing protein [Bacteroidales bacterium]|nr:T9SS type A sorting domain-containing protein [Bacteroidales bacterium]